MKYEVTTPVYNTETQLAQEDYVFVEANSEEEAAPLAIQMLKDQYPNGYYSVVNPEDEAEGLRFYLVTVNTERYGDSEPFVQENNNVTPPAPVDRKQG